MKYRGTETKLLDKAMIIMEDYLPIYWNSSNYRLDMLNVILDNKDWTMRMVKFVSTHEEDTECYKPFGYSKMITTTLAHDIGGLLRTNDEHFLPRI